MIPMYTYKYIEIHYIPKRKKGYSTRESVPENRYWGGLIRICILYTYIVYIYIVYKVQYTRALTQDIPGQCARWSYEGLLLKQKVSQNKYRLLPSGPVTKYMEILKQEHSTCKMQLALLAKTCCWMLWEANRVLRRKHHAPYIGLSLPSGHAISWLDQLNHKSGTSHAHTNWVAFSQTSENIWKWKGLRPDLLLFGKSGQKCQTA